MRPVVQVSVVKTLRHAVEQGTLSWDEGIKRLSKLDWRMGAAPFLAAWQETPGEKAKGKMATGKDASNLLLELLSAHLAPKSKAQIDRALRSFRSVKGKRYPLSSEELAAGIVTPPPTVDTMLDSLE
jgi:hypothetical protein